MAVGKFFSFQEIIHRRTFITTFNDFYRSPELNDAISSSIKPIKLNSVDLQVKRNKPADIITTIIRREQLYKEEQKHVEIIFPTFPRTFPHLFLQSEQNGKKTDENNHRGFGHCVSGKCKFLIKVCSHNVTAMCSLTKQLPQTPIPIVKIRCQQHRKMTSVQLCASQSTLAV